MIPFPGSTLQRASLVSQLVSAQQLERALAEAAADQSPPLLWPDVDDEQLGRKLVNLGYLNRWQVEQLRVGRTKFTLGPYRIIDAIGHGGMGHVFKGEHAMLGRVEAVKVLPKEKTTPTSIASFQHEIRAQAQLDHPNLVRVQYAGQDGDTYFCVTEFVDGIDLRRLVRRHGPLSVERAATIVAQAAAGLAHAHDKGLVHRDVKPGNVLVTEEGRTKLADLGLSAFWSPTSEFANDPKVGKIVGTADYLAPEAITDPATLQPVSDIYSLGCTLYYAVTAKVPFPGGKTSDKMRRHLEESPLNPQHFNSELPGEFVELLALMMEKSASRRLSTAAEVVARLETWAADPGSAVRSQLGSLVGTSKGTRHPGARHPSSPPGVADTASHVLSDDLLPDIGSASQSQISQGTEPNASAMQETMPIEPPLVRARPRKSAERSSQLATLLTIVAAAAALMVVAALLLKSF